ncbi:hypothetical protein LTR36_010690 [Oleoguttula mirabilis]|uniref:Uncharacterized protein n=1 Tax=Oleoguttula mirabilis TaxID=1507867 RepID=A0AAV9JR93_9PEZI|nr:hypothetical protein LTR36_010690 [Oleoguttula mirabilis]
MTEGHTSPVHSSDMSEGSSIFDTPQTVRTNGQLVDSVMPVSELGIAASKEIQAGIDVVVHHALEKYKCSHGEARWSVDRYGDAFKNGVRYVQ